MEQIELTGSDGARLSFTEYGAHVTSWHPVGSDADWLYLSPRTEFRAGAAIRGGVPVVFPQFSTIGPLPRHGFARTTLWRRAPADSGRARAHFELLSDAGTQAIWPARFAASLDADAAGRQLKLRFDVKNTGADAFSFTCALHTYFRVDDLPGARVEGLSGLPYSDSAAEGAMRPGEPDPIAFPGEIDRIYMRAPSPLVLRDGGRSVRIAQSGFHDVVVWNPGPVKCAALKDMPPDGYRHMVCVEAAQIERPVTLLPGESWSGEQLLLAL